MLSFCEIHRSVCVLYTLRPDWKSLPRSAQQKKTTKRKNIAENQNVIGLGVFELVILLFFFSRLLYGFGDRAKTSSSSSTNNNKPISHANIHKIFQMMLCNRVQAHCLRIWTLFFVHTKTNKKSTHTHTVERPHHAPNIIEPKLSW